MVEAAPKNVCRKILDGIKEHQNWLADESEAMPDFFERQAQGKIQQTDEFKESVMADAKMLEELRDDMMLKIKARVKSDDNPDGLC